MGRPRARKRRIWRAVDFQQVGAADHFRDLHGGVIDDYGELIGGDVVAAPDDEVSEIAAGG
jgi:hypothetical protein